MYGRSLDLPRPCVLSYAAGGHEGRPYICPGPSFARGQTLRFAQGDNVENAASAASSVALMSRSRCASESMQASNCDGGK
jgi:hypothetical protein